MIIDIHSHILPGVDDGSKDIEMSLDMAKLYVENGIKKVIASPHYINGSMDNSLKDNKKALERLKKHLFRQAIDLQVFLGNEIYVSMDTIDDISNKRVYTLNDSRYVLLELPMYDIPLYMEDLLYELQLKGYIPIIAHPERNAKIMEDPNILYNYIKNGSLGQINLPSLEGAYGKRVEYIANILLEHNMIHFIGSDAHTNRQRSPRVSEDLDKLERKVGKRQFEKISYKNPKLLLEDKPIKIEEARPYEARGRMFRFLKAR